MVKSWLLAELGPPQLLCAPLPGTKLTLEQRLKESCFEPKWFGCIGKRYGRGSSIYKFDPRTAWFDDLVRCAGGAEDLHEALRECAPFAGRVRELLCLAASRGEALELGLATWNRLQTDGNTADSLAMMLAAYLACFNHIDLLRDDVSALPYFVQILAEFVRFGLFKQDKETVELRYGEKLERFTAMAGRGNPTAADLLALPGPRFQHGGAGAAHQQGQVPVRRAGRAALTATPRLPVGAGQVRHGDARGGTSCATGV